ncbi:hypothetical protein DXG01_013421 [Tephrocybe rancida]|nr:hypothetical protein DXG01_013421 [Tephrocybe rancida]
MPVENAKLNDGNEMPVIAFGSGTVNKGTDASNLVIQAINMGFKHIDTAQTYDNEDSVGHGLQNSPLLREKLFVTTKYRSGAIQETFRGSLDKLKLKYVDLYLIHHPRFVDPDFEGSWKVLEKLKDDGFAKSIGVSNFNLEELQLISKNARIKPSVNQASPAHRIHLTFVSFAEAPITTYPGGPVDAPVSAAAERLGITPAQVIFSWVKAKGVAIVTTSSKKARLEEYLAVGDLSPLTEEEIAAIDEGGAKGPSPEYGTIPWDITPGLRVAARSPPIPEIGYGTGTALRDKDVSDWVVQAVETGFSHIDTAQMYNNEATVGNGIRKSGLARQDLFVTTKYSVGLIQEAVRSSLTKLGLSFVDLYLIHIPEAVQGASKAPGGKWN